MRGLEVVENERQKELTISDTKKANIVKLLLTR